MKSIFAIMLTVSILVSTALVSKAASAGDPIKAQTTRTIRSTKSVTNKNRRNIRANPYKKEWGAHTLNFRRKHRRVHGRKKRFDHEGRQIRR